MDGRMYQDRRDAGRQLAEEVAGMGLDDAVVLGMPRGGVPVAAEVASRLHAPLDVLVVRKIGAPHNPEFGVGAIGEGGVELLDASSLQSLGLTRDALQDIIQAERSELQRRVQRFRGGRPPVEVAGRTAVLVDDGVATGVSASAAIRVLRARGASRVVLAVPVAAPRSIEMLREEADEVVCLAAPAGFVAVGAWYRDFAQTSDDEVERILRRSHEAQLGSAERQPGGQGQPDRAEGSPRGHGSAGSSVGSERVEVALDLVEVTLPGDLTVPRDARGVIAFAHGSGSSRKSPRNRQVAATLNEAGFATLLFDLLTEREAADRAKVFDIRLLSSRLALAVEWVRQRRETAMLPVGLFGASTGAAAALVAAVECGDAVRAVVSRGGRVDMAAGHLEQVKSPVLMIVGGADVEVLRLNRAAAEQLVAEHEVAVIEGAGHLFEGPGELEQVADLAAEWFGAHLT